MATEEKEKTSVVLDKLVQTLDGKLFYSPNIQDSLRKALEFSKGGGFVAPMWLLAKGFPHKEWYTANSEDNSGLGEFRGVKGNYVVTLHGGVDGNGILTPDIIATALEMHKSGNGGLTKVHSVDLSQLFKANVFADLLQGGMPDGSAIPVYSFDQVIAGEHLMHLSNYTRFAIARTLEQARKTISGYESIDSRVDREGKVNDSQVIAYAAGASEGQNFIKSARSFKSGKQGVWHPFNNEAFEPDKSQSRVLFLGDDDDGGLDGYYYIDDDARFAGVAPKARAAMQSSAGQMLDATTKSALEAGEGFAYKGMLYAPIAAKNVNLQK